MDIQTLESHFTVQIESVGFGGGESCVSAINCKINVVLGIPSKMECTLVCSLV